VKPTLQNLLDHLEPVLGQRPRTEAASGATLPLFLRDHYRLHETRLFGRDYLLAVEEADRDAGSAAEYESHARQLAAKLGREVVLVPRALSPYARNRLVQLGVPFIVPGSQTFLPLAMLDLRERFGPQKPVAREKLAPLAQLLVLWHLVREPLDGLPLRDIAARLGYTAMAVTRAKDELEAARLCEAVRKGRSLVLRFHGQGRVLWHKAEPLLASPVAKEHWLIWDRPAYPALRAGISALSKRTMIGDDPLPTFAVDARVFRDNLEQGLYRGCRVPEEANVRLEVWRYDPLLLGDRETVDPLSLYLSLRDSPDERIQQQLVKLIDSVSW